MKPNKSITPDFHTFPVSTKREGLRKTEIDNPLSFQNITVPHSMTQQEVAPPAYMWDRIAKVLDEQDRTKGKPSMGSYSLSHANVKVAESSKKIIFYAALAVVAGAIILTVV